MVRATRRVACSLPRFGTSRSIFSGSELGPSTSFSMIGTQLSARYRVNSNWTRASSIGIVEGRISGFRSPFSHRLWITAAINRSTPYPQPALMAVHWLRTI